MLASSCVSNFSVGGDLFSQVCYFSYQVMLTPKEGEKVCSLNGEIILPAICYYFVSLVFIVESLIKLRASCLGGNRIFFRQ